MLLETRCYPLVNPCWGDHPTFDGHRWMAEVLNSNGDYGQLNERFRRSGIKYILVNLGRIPGAMSEAMRTISRGDQTATEVHRRRLVWGFYHLERFLDRCAKQVHSSSGISIFEIKDE